MFLCVYATLERLSYINHVFVQQQTKCFYLFVEDCKMNLGKGVLVRTFLFRLFGRAVAMWSLSTLGQMAAPTNPTRYYCC